MSDVTASEITAAVAGRTLLHYFRDTVSRRGGEVALRWRGADAPGQWTWNDYATLAGRLATSLARFGVRPGERVLLMMENRPEFHLADTATLMLGATPVSVYNSSSPEQIAHLASHSSATVAVVSGGEFLDRFHKAGAGLGPGRVVAVGEADPTRDAVWFDDLLESDALDLDTAVTRARPDDLATIIYTSGTTGPPKGVQHSHAGVCWMVESTTRALESSMGGWHLLSYMPMAHVAERTMTHWLHLCHGSVVTTCPDPTQLGAYLAEVRPTFLGTVPRVWEKLRAGILAIVNSQPEIRPAFEAGLAVGRRAGALIVAGRPVDTELDAEWRAIDDAVFAPVKARVGLDRCRMALTGAAPTPPELFEFFLALRLPIAEAYGLSETGNLSGWSPRFTRPNTVGRPLPGQEVRLLDDGELVCRGGNLFVGYLNDPERTAEVLGADGWLRTGDLAEIDADGYIRIIDRKKEIIITSGGKNISPVSVENALKAGPLIGQACVIGDGRPYITALLVLDPEVLPGWAEANGIGPLGLAQLATHPAVRAEVERQVQCANATLARVEQVKRFTILPSQWLPDSDELTPTMKLKRRVITTKYAAEIELLYGAAPK